MIYFGDWCYFGILHCMPRPTRPWEPTDKGSSIYHMTLFGKFYSVKGRYRGRAAKQ